MAIGENLLALDSDLEITTDDITDAKLIELRTEIEACTPEQSAECIRILDEAIPRATGDAKVGLQGLRDDLNSGIQADESTEVQINGNYSTEYLRENSEGFLSKLLEIEIVPGIDAMKAFMLTQGTEHIGSELLNIMPEAARENFQILTWNKVVNSIGISSVFRHGADSFFSGFSGILGGEETSTDNEGSGLSIDSFTEIADSIQNFNNGDTDANGTLQIPDELAILNGGSTEIAVPSGIAKGFDYLESLSLPYFTNMKSLLGIAKDQGIDESENFKSLLSHPKILQTILETGQYKQDGINVDLNSSTLVLSSISQEDIRESGMEVMQEIIGSSNALSGKIDGILSQTDKFITLFEKLGIDPSAIKETLFQMPVIGFIFKILFGDFLDTIESRMSALNEAPEVKKAMETLGGYIENPDNKNNLPFELNEENPGKISENETGILKGFIKKLRNVVPAEGDEQNTKARTILEHPRLAKQLFTGEGILEGDEFLQKIHAGIIALFGVSVKPTQAEFFEKLKSIDLSAVLSEEIVTVSGNEIPDSGVQAPVNDADFIGPRQPSIDETAPTDEDFIGPMPEVTTAEDASTPSDTDQTTIPGGNQIDTTPSAMEEVLSIEDQVSSINEFPATIILEDGSQSVVSYNPSNKSIEIGSDSYTITSLQKNGRELLGTAFNLNSLDFINGEGSLQLDTTPEGEALIYTANLLKQAGTPDIELETGNILDVPLTSEDMQQLILGLIQNKIYQTTQTGIDIIVS